MWFKLAPISPISNLPEDPPTNEPFVPSEQPDVFQEGFQESSSDEPIDKPSVLSTLPVALVVEQTARILEDIKRKIQLQKEEVERQKLEATSEPESLSDYTFIKPVPESPRKTTFDEEIFRKQRPKSFIILNSRYGDNTIQPSISPIKNNSNPRSLSSDSGTDYEPFSASSSISPPFSSTVKQANNDFNYDLMKFSNDKSFKPLPNLPSFTPSTLPLNLTPLLSTSPMSSERRFSGITMSQVTTASLAKSSPSISTDLVKEIQQQQSSTSPSTENKRPFSFQVLRTNTTSALTAIDTYQDRLSSSIDTSRYKSIPSLSYGAYPAPFPTSFISSAKAVSSQLTGLLANNMSTFGDPSAIKPIVSALEYPPYKLSIDLPASAPSYSRTFTVEKQAKSFDDAGVRLTTLEKYEKVLEKQKMHLELSHKQQQADFLSLSLSPPLNRKNLSTLKGMSMWVAFENHWSFTLWHRTRCDTTRPHSKSARAFRFRSRRQTIASLVYL